MNEQKPVHVSDRADAQSSLNVGLGGMSAIRPEHPGWYWYLLPGSWALQPCYVFTLGVGYSTLYYTLQAIEDNQDPRKLDCFAMDEASEESLWSKAQIGTPNTKSVSEQYHCGDPYCGDCPMPPND